jgi:hypothetical protein
MSNGKTFAFYVCQSSAEHRTYIAANPYVLDFDNHLSTSIFNSSDVENWESGFSNLRCTYKMIIYAFSSLLFYSIILLFTLNSLRWNINSTRGTEAVLVIFLYIWNRSETTKLNFAVIITVHRGSGAFPPGSRRQTAQYNVFASY